MSNQQISPKETVVAVITKPDGKTDIVTNKNNKKDG
jgi:hypothetical protein